MIKRYVIIFFLVFFFIFSTHASHISGGEIYYSLVSQSGNNYTYKVTLKLLRDVLTPGGVQLSPTEDIAIYEKGTNALVWSGIVDKTHFETITISNPSSCLINPPQVKYDIALYERTVTIQGSANGYVIINQNCCRYSGISNIIGPASASATYMAEIPGNA